MDENQTAAYKILEQAQQALKSGDKNTAGQLAEQAVQLAPELEEVWLLKAALAVPSESITYLQKALQINPSSVRAQKGLAWALERSDQAPAAVGAIPQPDQPYAEEQGTAKAGYVEQAAEQGGQEPLQAVEDVQADQASNQAPPLVPTDGEELGTARAGDTGQDANIVQTESTSEAASVPPAQPAEKRASSRRLWIAAAAVLLVILLCLAAVWASRQGGISITGLLSNPLSVRDHGPAWAQVKLAKPQAARPTLVSTATGASKATSQPVLVSATPGQGLMANPTETASPTALAPTETQAAPTETQAAPTFPVTILPTDTVVPPSDTPVPPTDTQIAPTFPVTILPSVTPLPTGTQAAPTFPVTILPTDTALLPTGTLAAGNQSQPTATPDLSPSVQASPTPLPTDTSVAGGTAPQGAPTPIPSALPTPATPSLTGVKGHWFDVDLTHQMVYAYDGDTLVNSFLVSTGTWQYPTVTGQYHIYVKYRYANMTGPGYYLPNVPFTMYFYQGYALHGTYWHHNFGHPMSHGCVNLSIPDAEWVYNFASVGTLVNVHS